VGDEVDEHERGEYAHKRRRNGTLEEEKRE
jgi:hypothetical protein